MSRWIIDVSDKVISDRMKRYRSDIRVINGYRSAISILSESEDPATVGKRKSGRLRNCYSYDITRSYRLIYTVNYAERTIYIHDLGDHKAVFGRDGRA